MSTPLDDLSHFKSKVRSLGEKEISSGQSYKHSSFLTCDCHPIVSKWFLSLSVYNIGHWHHTSALKIILPWYNWLRNYQNSLRHLNCYTIFLNGLFPDFIFILFKQSTEYKCWKRFWVTWFELRSSDIESERCANCATTSVTRWLRYFSIFDHLQQPVWPDGYVIFQYLTFCNIERLPQNTKILPNTGWTLNHWATIHNILPKWLKFRQIWPHRRPQPSLMHYCFPNKASEHMYKLASLQRMSSIRTQQQQQQQPVNR